MRSHYKATIHRDMGAIDFDRLARFCYAVKHNRCNCVPLVLGLVPMRIPLWSHASGHWRITKFKDVTQEAFGLSVEEFRRICRYINVREAKLIDTLFRFSILGVVPDQIPGAKLRYRQIIEGIPLNATSDDEWTCGPGFVLERRRSEGEFRSKKMQISHDHCGLPSWF